MDVQVRDTDAHFVLDFLDGTDLQGTLSLDHEPGDLGVLTAVCPIVGTALVQEPGTEWTEVSLADARVRMWYREYTSSGTDTVTLEYGAGEDFNGGFSGAVYFDDDDGLLTVAGASASGLGSVSISSGGALSGAGLVDLGGGLHQIAATEVPNGTLFVGFFAATDDTLGLTVANDWDGGSAFVQHPGSSEFPSALRNAVGVIAGPAVSQPSSLLLADAFSGPAGTADYAWAWFEVNGEPAEDPPDPGGEEAVEEPREPEAVQVLFDGEEWIVFDVRGKPHIGEEDGQELRDLAAEIARRKRNDAETRAFFLEGP